MRRRDFLKVAGAAAVTSALPMRATAQVANWPDKPVKFIIPYAPGGGSDLIGRPWAEKLSQAFGQQFVIENRSGAGGMIGILIVTLAVVPAATVTSRGADTIAGGTSGVASKSQPSRIKPPALPSPSTAIR